MSQTKKLTQIGWPTARWIFDFFLLLVVCISIDVWMEEFRIIDKMD